MYCEQLVVEFSLLVYILLFLTIQISSQVLNSFVFLPPSNVWGLEPCPPKFIWPHIGRANRHQLMKNGHKVKYRFLV